MNLNGAFAEISSGFDALANVIVIVIAAEHIQSISPASRAWVARVSRSLHVDRPSNSNLYSSGSCGDEGAAGVVSRAETHLYSSLPLALG